MARPRRKSTIAELGFYTPIDYASWIQKTNWWTWELVSLVSCDYREPPTQPDHPLAYHFDQAPITKNHEGKEVPFILDPADLLEEQLRRATDAKNLTAREDERRPDGHRLLEASEGLAFILVNMGAINAKVKLEYERERSARKLINDRRKRVIATNKRVQRRNVRLYKKHANDPSLSAPVYLRQVHDYSLQFCSRVRKRWRRIDPKLLKLFIPEELTCLLNKTRSNSIVLPAGENTEKPALQWSDISFRLNGKRERHRLWVKIQDGEWTEANYITLGIRRPKKEKAPSRQWEVFISIIEGGGLLPNADKRIVFSLNESLIRWSKIESKPIEFDTKAGGYRSLFKVCEPAREREPATVRYDPEEESHNPVCDSEENDE